MKSFLGALRRVGIAFLMLVPIMAFVGSGAARAQACEGGVTFDLIAGQTNVVGEVTVSNDLNNLYVNYSLFAGTFGKLHLWVGSDINNLPMSSGNNPAPRIGHFPYHFDATELGSHTFVIPFTNLLLQDATTVCGQPLYVVAHAEVGSETAFGGNTAVNVGDPGRWWFYGVYTVCCDEDWTSPPGILSCGTAFGKPALKDGDGYKGYVFTRDRKSNPQGYYSLNLTKNRWGWAFNLLNPGPYQGSLITGAGLNRGGTNAGTVTIDWDGVAETATVTYQTIAPYTLKEIHVYAGDNPPTTLAPGQYGNTAYTAGPSYTVEVPVTDTPNGDGIWLITHSVVCKPAAQ